MNHARGTMPFSRFLALFLALALAQQPANPDHDMSHGEQAHTHDGFMQGRMHHVIAQGVTLNAHTDADAHTITLRVGPLTLSASTSHRNMPQPADLIWSIPVTGWLLAYHPKLVDANGNSVPGVV